MRIVVLDGFALNPGDLAWSALEALGDCTVHDRTAADETLARARGAEALLTNKTVLNAATLEVLPQLRYAGVLATGYNVVDTDAARRRGVIVTNVPGYSTPSAAQATLALLLELTNGAGHHSRAVREGRWATSPDFCFWDRPLVELAGRTMGVVGFGAIGQAVAKIAQALGMTVLVHTRTERPTADVRFVDMDTLFAQSDVVSLHCPLTPETQGLVNADRLARMKPTAFLLNTSRGPLIDEAALARALNEGRLAGAAVDVLSTEPPSADNPLLTAQNCLITPHIAWATQAARRRLLDTATDNLRAFLAGRPVNVVG